MGIEREEFRTATPEGFAPVAVVVGSMDDGTFVPARLDVLRRIIHVMEHSRRKWEYRCFCLQDPYTWQDVQDLGLDGWELVSVVNEKWNDGEHERSSDSFYFKREVIG